MSEHIFGLHKGHLRSKADEIAKRHGAWHINFTEPRGEKRGWFACPNRGTAFDQATANDVLAAIDAAGGLNAMRRADRAAVSLGRRGGKAGTGASQRRSPEQYAAIQAKALAARRHAKDYVAERPGGWGVLRWDEGRQIHVEGPVYPTKRQALEILRGE